MSNPPTVIVPPTLPPRQPLAWVTGVTGFLGGQVARTLTAAGWRVLGLSRTPLESAVACPEFDRITGPFNTELLERALARHGPPAVVFHSIGSGSVRAALTDTLADFERTVTSTARLVEVLRRLSPAPRLIYPSSAAVYGITPRGPVSEDAVLAPVSPYGLHKFLAEALCRHAGRVYGLPVAVVRFFSVFGPGQRKLLLWDLGRRLLSGERPVTLSGTGDEVRDLITADDAADLIVRLAGADIVPPVLNAGSGRAITVREIAEGLAAALGLATPIVFTGEVRAGDPPHYQADIGRLQAFGAVPQLDLARSLARYADWLRRVDA